MPLTFCYARLASRLPKGVEKGDADKGVQILPDNIGLNFLFMVNVVGLSVYIGLRLFWQGIGVLDNCLSLTVSVSSDAEKYYKIKVKSWKEQQI